MKIKVIIVPVYNQHEFLIKCVSSILFKTFGDFKLIIVNDNSNNETVVVINRIKSFMKNCIVINNEKSLGFSGACNIGIDYAMMNIDFNCLCLLNSDTEIITDDWFNIVESEMINMNAGVASVVSNHATYQSIINVDLYLKNIEKKPTIINNLVHGFCYFINKKLISKIGRLDDDMFPHYGSEDDYSLKSIKSGFCNIVVGKVFVMHNGSKSYTSNKDLHLKVSVPSLLKRWGETCINEFISNSIDMQKKLNE